MKNKLYIRDSIGRVRACPDVLRWAAWMENHDNQVKYTEISKKVHVSTVFLGIDHNFSGKGKPVLYETLIFGGPYNEDGTRYTSRSEAVAGHKAYVALAKGKRSRG